MLDVSLPRWVEGWRETILVIVSVNRLSAVPTPSESLFMWLGKVAPNRVPAAASSKTSFREQAVV